MTRVVVAAEWLQNMAGPAWRRPTLSDRHLYHLLCRQLMPSRHDFNLVRLTLTATMPKPRHLMVTALSQNADLVPRSRRCQILILSRACKSAAKKRRAPVPPPRLEDNNHVARVPAAHVASRFGHPNRISISASSCQLIGTTWNDTVHIMTHFHTSSSNSRRKRLSSPLPPPRRHARQVKTVDSASIFNRMFATCAAYSNSDQHLTLVLIRSFQNKSTTADKTEQLRRTQAVGREARRKGR